MAWSYDLAKLHAQVRDLLPPGCAFKIGFEIWDHGRTDGTLDVEVAIYDSDQAKGFYGETPDEALNLLRTRLAEETGDVQPENLGVVRVPENAA